ncbi:MAG: UMP kinase [Oscillospiraceae bacterium]|jgi:uridylate kinase|nr:UMP kinase [Oscillospiraceae bacterium]
MLKYKRVLLKLSGEALAGKQGSGIDFSVAEAIGAQLKDCIAAGAQIAVVVGGGNFWRGRAGGGMDAVRADQMGMLATMINAIALTDTFEQAGVPVLLQAAFQIPQVAPSIHKASAVEALEAGKVVLFGGGTGNPFFTTDSAAALWAAEIEAEAVLKATNVDGVYDSDPKQNLAAVKYDTLTLTEVLERRLGVMDATAAALCQTRRIPMVVFGQAEPANILRVLHGEAIGTTVTA